MDEYGLFGKAGSYNALAGGCAKIARLDTGATLFDVNSAQPYSNDHYREPSVIIRIGMDQYEGQLCEKVIVEDDNSNSREIQLSGDVITEHNKVFENQGRVMFGRFDELCYRWWTMLHNFLGASHVEWGVKLLIVLRKGSDYQGFSTRAFKVDESCPDSRLVPEYYRDLIPYCYVWFEIGKFAPMDSNELRRYVKDIAWAVKRKRSISKTLADAGY